MIAEYLFNLTQRLGNLLNNATPSDVSGIYSGITAVWIMIILLLGIAICEFVYILLLEKENKVVKDND